MTKLKGNTEDTMIYVTNKIEEFDTKDIKGSSVEVHRIEMWAVFPTAIFLRWISLQKSSGLKSTPRGTEILQQLLLLPVVTQA